MLLVALDLFRCALILPKALRFRLRGDNSNRFGNLRWVGARNAVPSQKHTVPWRVDHLLRRFYGHCWGGLQARKRFSKDQCVRLGFTVHFFVDCRAQAELLAFCDHRRPPRLRYRA